MASWFSKLAHPFVAALASLEANPAITSSPQAAAAVADAKIQAEAVTSTAGAAASAIVADVQTASDPAVNALDQALIVAADAYLMKALGPVGEAIVGPAANTLIALGEARAHALIAGLFAQAKAQLPAPKPA